MIWRIRRRLDVGSGKVLYPGSLSTLHWLDKKGLQRLQMKGAISEVSAPPLVILPGWTLRSERLSKVGIEYADEFIEGDEEKVASSIGVHVRTVRKWKEEIEAWLTADREEST